MFTTASTTDIYADWTGNRTISSFGTNDGASPLAFQTWHRFKEAFPPEVVHEAVRASQTAISNCLDPFGGSGTTALTCQMLGIESTTVEVNPFLADVIEAKLHRYDVDGLVSALAHVRAASRRIKAEPDEIFGEAPQSFLEPGTQDRWLFDRSVAERLAALRVAIEGLEDPSFQRLFRVIAGGLLSDVSNVIVSGKGRRYRRNWRAMHTPVHRVDRLFAQRAEQAVLDIQRYSKRPNVRATVVRGDARKVKIEGTFDLAIFSPPYPNSFDYTDVYNVELWMLGYLRDRTQNRDLRQSTLTSHVQVGRNYKPAPSGSGSLDTVMNDLVCIRKKLWNASIPEMIGGYFADLVLVLERARKLLRPGTDCWLVVGDSSYGGVAVPVGHVLTELCSSRGWAVRTQTPFRHMKSSAQQGWRPQLAETLLVLQSA